MKLKLNDVLKELYGCDIDVLLELDKKCQEVGVEWFHLFHWTEEDEEKFIQYMLKKYKLYPKKLWERELKWVMLSYAPTLVKEVYEKARAKVRDNPEIGKLLSKVHVWNPKGDTK